MIALLILVFVDAHDAATPLPGALARAAEEALGAGVSVSIRTLDRPSPVTGLADAGRAEHAAAVARIVWTDERRTEARLEVVGADGGPTRASTIAFADSDPLAERGRALGLVLAALVAPEKQARLEREAAAREVAAPAPTVVASPPPPPPPPPRRRFALDAAAEGGFALAGAGSGFGGALGVRWYAGRRLGLRAGVQARFGEVASAQATALDLGGRRGSDAVRHPAVRRTPVRPRGPRRRAAALSIALAPFRRRRRTGPERARPAGSRRPARRTVGREPDAGPASGWRRRGRLR